MKRTASIAAAAVAAALAAAAVAAGTIAQADEGMWTFDNPPTARIQQTYGFTPDQAWLDQVRGSAVRLSIGCSAALVSEEGLVQTNHHCVASCVQSFSAAGEDSLRNGFRAATRADERQCPGWRAHTLTSIEDVTADIEAATRGTEGEAFAAARDARIAALESACIGDAADRFCEVVTLYQGGQYKLYAYKQYEDVRLAFAPELDAGFFGGDPDNFSFPRYAFDVAFVRLYENGAPAQTPTHLSWRSDPLQEGELTFVVGHPGSTSRLLTTAQLAFERDHMLPWRLATLSEVRGRMIAFAAQGDEQRRQVSEDLQGVENTFKAFTGRRLALVDPVAFGAVAQEEADFRARIARNARLQRLVGDAYDEIAATVAVERGMYLPYQYLERRAGGGATLFWAARHLVRAAEERGKPDGERMLAYTEARLPALEGAVLADQPMEPGLQQISLEWWLEKMREYLTADDPRVRAVLGAESPAQMAARLVAESRLADPAVRRALWEGGAAAIAASDDPMIQLARRIDADARALHDQYESQVQAPIARAQERIAQARFELLGDSVYPDATFTLRLSYGVVRGWEEPGGRAVPAFTTTRGLWERATGAPPYAVVDSWVAARDALDPATPFNLVTTHDIIGGNSGSPLVDRQGHVAGAVFDGNLHSLGGAYFYDERRNRTVSVASPIIEEALVDVYGMQRLVDELKN